MSDERTPSATSRTGLATALLGAAIALAAYGAYSGALDNAFVWDTLYYLRYSPNWAPGSGPGALLWMLFSTEVSNWHPLTWLSWAIDYRLYGGLVPAGFHLTNVILHAMNSLLVAWLAFEVFTLHERNVDSIPTDRINRMLAAALCGALFAVHPQHVQSVAWVAERKDLLCQLFMIASILAYLRGQLPEGDNRGRTWSLFFFVLAAMSKPMAVSLPLVLLILDHYPLCRTPCWRDYRRDVARLLLEKIPFFIIAAALGLMTLLAQAQGGAMVEVPFQIRLLNAFNSISLYWHKFLWPVDYSPFYPYALRSIAEVEWRHWIPVAEFLLLTAAAIMAWRRGRYGWLTAWLIYLVTLSPVLGILQVGIQGAADRYAYFPTLPFYVLLGGMFLGFHRKPGRHPGRRALVWIAALAVLAGLSLQTRLNVRSWNNSLSLWTQAYRQFPDDRHINVQLGITLLNAGLNEAAAGHFERAAHSERGPTETLAWRGVAYMRLGRYRDAVDAFITLGVNADRISGLVLDEECVQYNIGWSLARLGARTDSIDLFSRIESDPLLSRDARAWIDWLTAHPDPVDMKTMSAAALPAQCEHPLPRYTAVRDRAE